MLWRKAERTRKDLDEASAAYERAVESAGAESLSAAAALGYLRLQEGRYDEAADAYQRAIDLGDPAEAARAARALGWIRHEQGRLDEAVAAYTLAIESGDPEEAATAARSLGVLRFEQERFDDARQAYQQAVDVGHGEQSAIALYDLGTVEAAQGHVDDAARNYRLAIDTGRPEAAGPATRALRELQRQQSAVWRALDSQWLTFGAVAGFIFLSGGARYVALGVFVVLVVLGYMRRGVPETTQGRIQMAFLIAALLLVVLGAIGGVSAAVSAFLLVPILVGFFIALFAGDRDLGAPVSKAEALRFAGWCSALAVAAVTSTVIVIDQAPNHASDHSWVPEGGSLACTGVILLLAVLGGLWVFRPRAPWLVVIVWSFLGAMLSWLVQYPAWIVMGATRSHGVVGSCVTGHSCDQFAYVAGFIAYTSPVLIAVCFVAAFGVRRAFDRHNAPGYVT